MNNNQNNFYDSIHDYVKGSTMAAWVFWLSVVLLLIGINNFIEDTYSSYIGVQQIEKTFQVKAVSWWVTYLGMSLAFQVITVIAGITYMSDRKKYWLAAYVAIGAQAIDFVADVWYRANGVWLGWTSVSVSFVLTFVFFTIGSEFAVTVGLGLVARLFVEGMAQTAVFVRNIIAGFGKLAQILASGSADGKGATHANITHGFQDVKHNPNQNQGGGKPQGNQNQGGGRPQGNVNDPNRKPNWKPNQGGGGEKPRSDPPRVEDDAIDPETLKRLFSGKNSDGSDKSNGRGGSPFR